MTMNRKENSKEFIKRAEQAVEPVGEIINDFFNKIVAEHDAIIADLKTINKINKFVITQQIAEIGKRLCDLGQQVTLMGINGEAMVETAVEINESIAITVEKIKDILEKNAALTRENQAQA